ncbi:hypothetical protein LTS18_003803 [Coniosporium uncinatum]|uniref:Uncharacterized protein n=1 Tax=Coniosporium uncinatum TaxID=93489 RepID=A0ACC3D6V5_9PEZI|nr:hypothetical protein LTS18_003803 [Coniosporium uncinatum]
MLLMLPRRPDLTPEQFREHYENGHAPLINSLCEDPNLRPILYKRMYFVAELMGPSGYDCVTEIQFRDQEHFQQYAAVMQAPETKAKIEDDEGKFLNRDGVKMVIVDPVQ